MVLNGTDGSVMLVGPLVWMLQKLAMAAYAVSVASPLAGGSRSAATSSAWAGALCWQDQPLLEWAPVASPLLEEAGTDEIYRQARFEQRAALEMTPGQNGRSTQGPGRPGHRGGGIA